MNYSNDEWTPRAAVNHNTKLSPHEHMHPDQVSVSTFKEKVCVHQSLSESKRESGATRVCRRAREREGVCARAREKADTILKSVHPDQPAVRTFTEKVCA